MLTVQRQTETCCWYTWPYSYKQLVILYMHYHMPMTFCMKLGQISMRVCCITRVMMNACMVATWDWLWNSLTFPWPFPDCSMIFPDATDEHLLSLFKRNVLCMKNNKNFMCTILVKKYLVHPTFLEKIATQLYRSIFLTELCTEMTGYCCSINIVFIKSQFSLTMVGHFSQLFSKVSIFPDQIQNSQILEKKFPWLFPDPCQPWFASNGYPNCLLKSRWQPCCAGKIQ